MPTYEYLCHKCGKFEEIQSIVAPALEKCPSCGSAVNRVISGGAGMIFKGSGFYATDYRSGDYNKRKKEEGSQAAPVKTEASNPAGEKAAGTTEKKAEGPSASPSPGASGSSGVSGNGEKKE